MDLGAIIGAVTGAAAGVAFPAAVAWRLLAMHREDMRGFRVDICSLRDEVRGLRADLARRVVVVDDTSNHQEQRA